MSDPRIETVTINAEPCRIWRKGEGTRIAFLAGFGGLPKWIPFLDRLAEQFEVVVPSLPGYPGGEGHQQLDTHLDWVVAVRDLLDAAGLEDGTHLVGSGPGGSFAAEMAALWPHKLAKLALIAPWGLFDDTMPMTDPWAQRKPELAGMLCANPARWDALRQIPEGVNSTEWPVLETRAMEASARAFWPLGNTRLERRLGRIRAPTLLIWGAQDRILSPGYAARFESALGGPVTVQILRNAGHLAELDQPDAVADAVRRFMA